MNDVQFDVLAKLLRSRNPSREAARLVLVEGWTRKNAAEQTGLAGPSVSGVVKRFREADTLLWESYFSAVTLNNGHHLMTLTLEKQREAQTALLRTALAWWEAHRPAGWALREHLHAPTVGVLKGEQALAHAVAAVVSIGAA